MSESQICLFAVADPAAVVSPSVPPRRTLDLHRFTHLRVLNVQAFRALSAHRLVLPPSLVEVRGGIFAECRADMIDMGSCHELKTLSCSMFARCNVNHLVWPPNLTDLQACAFESANIAGPLPPFPATIVKLQVMAFAGMQTAVLDFAACHQIRDIPNACFVGATVDSLVMPPLVRKVSTAAFQRATVRQTEGLSMPATLRTCEARAFASLSTDGGLDLSLCCKLKPLPKDAVEEYLAVRLPQHLLPGAPIS